jgi:hypothetical protein
MIVCLAPDGTVELCYDDDHEGKEPPWVEVDDQVYDFEARQGADLIYRRPS